MINFLEKYKKQILLAVFIITAFTGLCGFSVYLNKLSDIQMTNIPLLGVYDLLISDWILTFIGYTLIFLFSVFFILVIFKINAKKESLLGFISSLLFVYSLYNFATLNNVLAKGGNDLLNGSNWTCYVFYIFIMLALLIIPFVKKLDFKLKRYIVMACGLLSFISLIIANANVGEITGDTVFLYILDYLYLITLTSAPILIKE